MPAGFVGSLFLVSASLHAVLLICPSTQSGLVRGEEPSTSAPAEEVKLLADARAALAGGDLAKAEEAATQAIGAAPRSPLPWLYRARVRSTRRKYSESLDDYNELLKIEQNVPEYFDERGSVRFMLGNFQESLADFDRQLELSPAQAPYHWKRGLTLYYLGMYAEGRKQFEGYQTVDDNDVENVVWRYLCMAKEQGVDAAKAGLLSVKQDRRVPLMTAYDLYRGQATPEQVLKAAESDAVADDERLSRRFYGHLYVGLYYDSQGKSEMALEHLKLAADKYRVPHYMGEVARLHVEMLNKQQAKKGLGVEPKP